MELQMENLYLRIRSNVPPKHPKHQQTSVVHRSLDLNRPGLSTFKDHYIHNPMSKFKLPKDFVPAETFHVELTADQMNYLAAVLPAGYSLQVEPRKNIPKHALPATKKKANQLHLLNAEESVSHMSKKESINKNTKKGAMQPASSISEKPNQNKNAASNSSAKWVQQISEPLKRCAKIFSLLKNHKSSWPFLQPVNAEALGIPEYYQIIKQPMDLSKIQQKLKAEKYADFSDFQSDVLKIIENSYRFNETNEEFLKLTTEFENFFAKIIADPQELKSSKNINKKKKKSSAANRENSELAPVTLLEKKQLALQIRRLGKEHLKGVASIVFDGNEAQSDQFDLEKLSQKKLRDLQRFIRNRIIHMEQKIRNNQLDKNEITNLDMFESDDSSFETDGDKQFDENKRETNEPVEKRALVEGSEPKRPE